MTKQGWGAKDPAIQAMGFGEKGFAPFKEFVVERDDAQTDGMSGRSTELEVWKANPSLELPGRICPNSLCPTAQKCQVKTQCFSD